MRTLQMTWVSSKQYRCPMMPFVFSSRTEKGPRLVALAWVYHSDNSGDTWDEITYPFSNFNGATVEVWEWINNFIRLRITLRQQGQRLKRNWVWRSLYQPGYHSSLIIPFTLRYRLATHISVTLSELWQLISPTSAMRHHYAEIVASARIIIIMIIDLGTALPCFMGYTLYKNNEHTCKQTATRI